MSTASSGELLKGRGGILGVLSEVGKALEQEGGGKGDSMEVYGDVVHRVMYIADELYQEEQLNAFEMGSDHEITKNALRCIKKFSEASGPNSNFELQTLCQQFIGLCGADGMI